MSKSLLLLPPPPTEPNLNGLRAAYQPSITAALVRLSSLNPQNGDVLEVAVSCPGWFSRLSTCESGLFTEAQHLLAGLYALICAICEQSSIDQDGPQGLDIRVILTTYNESEKTSQEGKSPVRPTGVGPIIDLQTFALTRRRWKFLFRVDGKQGEAIFDRYTALSNLISPTIQDEIFSVEAGVGLSSTATIAPQLRNPDQLTSSCHTAVVVGGTFDHLHAGHKLLLTAMALLVQPQIGSSINARRLIVGLTGDTLLKNKKYAEYLMSWEQRRRGVVDFLTAITLFVQPGQEQIETREDATSNVLAVHTELKQAALTIECVEIHDVFGPTITDATISALVVSRETRSGGVTVNERRAEMGWPALEVFEVDVLDGDDRPASSTAMATAPFATKISSTAIREREAWRARKTGA